MYQYRSYTTAVFCTFSSFKKLLDRSISEWCVYIIKNIHTCYLDLFAVIAGAVLRVYGGHGQHDWYIIIREMEKLMLMPPLYGTTLL